MTANENLEDGDGASTRHRFINLDGKPTKVTVETAEAIATDTALEAEREQDAEKPRQRRRYHGRIDTGRRNSGSDFAERMKIVGIALGMNVQ